MPKIRPGLTFERSLRLLPTEVRRYGCDSLKRLCSIGSELSGSSLNQHSTATGHKDSLMKRWRFGLSEFTTSKSYVWMNTLFAWITFCSPEATNSRISQVSESPADSKNSRTSAGWLTPYSTIKKMRIPNNLSFVPRAGGEFDRIL